jgi:hypothetical protein
MTPTRKRHRTKKKAKVVLTAPVKIPKADAAQEQPPSCFLDVDDMFVMCRLWGLPSKKAFILAMQLAACGVTAGQARQIFDDSSRWVQ